MNDVLRGVLFSLGGNIAISIGDHLKVFGEHQNNGGKKLYHGKTRSKNRIYPGRFLFSLSGYILMIVGQIFNGYALAFAPQTLLACIGSVQFIMNLICSSILMSRVIKTIHIVGTFSIIIGCLVMIFGFSPKTDTSQLTVYALFSNFNSYHYRNYLMLVVLIFIGSTIICPYIQSTYLTAHHSSTNTNKCTKSHRNSPAPLNKNKQNRFCCSDPRLIAGFLYSFSSAMTGTQSVVLGKTLAIIIRNYAAGKIVIFYPLDLFILCFIAIVFVSFIVTFIYWLHRRTESMVLFDTVFIAPMNQVMWLTFSTVAGGIYFHEFENAYLMQWIALISGMMFNYIGLYYLVPTAADQPILIINMEKAPQKKCIDAQKKVNISKTKTANRNKPKRKHIKRNENTTNVIVKATNTTKHDGYERDDDDADDCEISISSESSDSEQDDDEEEELHIDIDNLEEVPLLSSTPAHKKSVHRNSGNDESKWFHFFAAKRH